MSKTDYYSAQTKNEYYRYVPVRQAIRSEELGNYATYGISVQKAEREIALISDVTTEYSQIKRLTDLCTQNQLDPDHLDEVLEDFFAECSAAL